MAAAHESPAKTLVLAITGASGAAYAVRLLEVLVDAGHDVHLAISPAGRQVLKHELDIDVDLQNFSPASLLRNARPLSNESTEPNGPHEAREEVPGGAFHARRGRIVLHQHQDFMSPIASGSFLTSGMVICPCSGGTLSGVVHGASSNLIQRAADVHLKERRKLILVPRETPLSIVQIDNMRRAAEAGAVVLPASPGFYHGAKSIQDLIDFVVARICDQLEVRNSLIRRWGEDNG